jgi:anti-sigma factor RsiW
MTIDCSQARLLLHAAIDSELDAANALGVEAHLAGCPGCTRERARLLELRAAIREGASRHKAPDALRDSLMRTLGAAPEPQQIVIPFRARSRSWRRPAASGFAVGAALAASLALVVDRATLDDTATGSIVAAHIRALQPGHLTDVQVSDRHQVKPWFDGKIDFAPPVKDLSDQGFDLVGGRLDYVDGRPAAAIVYRRRLHLIDVLITKAGRGAPAAATSSGYNIEHWAEGGQDFWAISDLNPSELADFVKIWRGR